jgi:hypothetical protein
MNPETWVGVDEPGSRVEDGEPVLYDYGADCGDLVKMLRRTLVSLSRNSKQLQLRSRGAARPGAPRAQTGSRTAACTPRECGRGRPSSLVLVPT